MMGSAARNAIPLSDTQQISQKAGNFATRKIWLPKLLYSALPYFYIGSGIAAFFATLYISEWFWVLPHYLLFSAVCVHLGFIVYRRRTRFNAGADDPGSS